MGVKLLSVNRTAIGLDAMLVAAIAIRNPVSPRWLSVPGVVGQGEIDTMVALYTRRGMDREDAQVKTTARSTWRERGHPLIGILPTLDDVAYALM